VTSDTVPAIGERVDAEIELLELLDGYSHGPPA
jgi:hypothetical protein